MKHNAGKLNSACKCDHLSVIKKGKGDNFIFSICKTFTESGHKFMARGKEEGMWKFEARTF